MLVSTMSALSAKVCTLCGYFSPTLRQLVSHIRQVHAGDAFELECCFSGCTKTFEKASSFSTHVYRCHRDAMGLEQHVSQPYGEHEDLSSTLTADHPEFDCDQEPEVGEYSGYYNSGPEEHNEEDQFLLPDDQLTSFDHQRRSARFILKLMEGHRLTQVAIGDVIGGCRELCMQTARQVKDSLESQIRDSGLDSSFIDLEAIDLFQDPFEGLSTPYLQEKYITENFNYVAPIEKAFGQPYYKDRFSGTKRQKVLRSDTFYYVPLLETLKQLLQNAEVRREIESPHQRGDAVLSDYCDGSLFKSHPLLSTDPHALQIIGYYDDLEVANPLGSYVHKHKLSCIFFSLGNIRPRYRSSLKSIFLVAVAKSKDVSKYGLNAFLTPFVEDLKRLYLDGITVERNGVTQVHYGALLAMLADTLAAQALGGFKESCSFALRICRTCMVTTPQSQECYSESECTVRTPENYEEQCLLLSGPLKDHFSTTYGINRRSVLEDVPDFSVTTGLPHDIMHDLYEGVVPYELKLLINHCVNSGYFTIAELNDRISHFDFIADTPTPIDPALRSGEHKLRQSASQMIALATEFPVLVGDKIPTTDEKWESFLLLLKICAIAMSPECSHDTIAYLGVLVEEKLSTFRRLYPCARIIPKLHFMVHYPGQIEMYGPLVHTWTMRHEAKLSFIKRASRRGNFKNICLTVAKTHQLWLCYQLECESHLVYPQPQTGPLIMQVDLGAEPQALQDEFRPHVEVSDASIVRHPRWLKIQSCMYKAGQFVLLDRDELDPTFGKITEIAVVSDCEVFGVQQYSTVYFDSHYNSFVVRPTGIFRFVSCNSLAYYRPLSARHCHVVSSKNLYVSIPIMYWH